MIIQIVLSVALVGVTTAASWVAPPSNRNDDVSFDFENNPLEIKTDSALNSDERIAVSFKSTSSGEIGWINVKFGTSITYTIGKCLTGYQSFPNELPSGNYKIWRFKKTADYGRSIYTVQIHCNDVPVLKVYLSNTYCTGNNNWKNFWGGDYGGMEKLKFSSDDTASDGYRVYEGWTAVERGEIYDNDVTKRDFELWTNKEIGKPGKLSLQFLDGGGNNAGEIKIDFSNKEYTLSQCSGPTTLMQANNILATPKVIVWRVRFSYLGTTPRITVYYNDIVVIQNRLSDTVCSSNSAGWRNVWAKKTKGIKILSDDDATKGFKPYTPLDAEPSVICSEDEVAFIRGTQQTCDKKWYFLKTANSGCVFDGNQKVISTKLNECDTKHEYTDEHVIYSNKVTCGDPTASGNTNGGNTITRENDPSGFLINCVYLRTGNVKNPQWSAPGETIVELGGEGYLKFALDVFTDSTYDKKETDFPLTVTLNNDLYMQVSVTTEDTAMSIAIVDVKATTSATDSASYVGSTYYLWRNGCQVDNTFEEVTQSPDDPKKERFKFKVFKFVASNDNIYIHAKVIVCGSDKSKCQFSCVRKRRAVTVPNEENTYMVSLGPLITTDPLEMEVQSGVCERMRYNILLLTMAPLPLVLMQ